MTCRTILLLLVTLSTTACVTRTTVVRVPVPVVLPPCVLFASPTPGADVTAGSAAEVAYLARLLAWAAYVDGACQTDDRPKWAP